MAAETNVVKIPNVHNDTHIICVTVHGRIAENILCLKKHANCETVQLKIIIIDFDDGRNIQNTLEQSMHTSVFV